MSATDYFMKTGMSTATTLSAPGYTVGNTSINIGTTAQLPTDTGVFIMIDEVETVAGEEVRVAGTYNVFRGNVNSGTQVNELVYVGGDANRNYSAGATTRVYMTISSYHTNRMIDGLLNFVDQDATLKAGAVDNAGVVADGILTAAKSTTATNIETRGSETIFDHVTSGLVWSGDAYGSTRVASMTSGVVYIAGVRVPVSAVTPRTFTASRDTYIDVGADGVVDYNEVTNNNASPALSASHIRIGIIVTGASNIANVGSVNQGQEDKVLPIASSIPYQVTDSLGNLICSRDPNRRVLGYRQRTSGNFTTATGTNGTLIPELSCPVIVPTGRKIKVTTYCPHLSNTGSPTNSDITMWEGTIGSGTQLTYARQTSGGANYGGSVTPMREYTPSSSSITLNSALVNVGGTLATAQCSSTGVMFIRVELV